MGQRHVQGRCLHSGILLWEPNTKFLDKLPELYVSRRLACMQQHMFEKRHNFSVLNELLKYHKVGRKWDQNVTVKSLAAEQTSEASACARLRDVPLLSHTGWCLEPDSAEQFSFCGQIYSWPKKRKKSRSGSSSSSPRCFLFHQCFSLFHHALVLPT